MCISLKLALPFKEGLVAKRDFHELKAGHIVQQ